MARVGEDLHHDRGIQFNIFCAKCGYNLRTRPTIGRCPECGNEYDARSDKLVGILLGNTHELLPTELGLMVISGAVGIWSLYWAVEEHTLWLCFPGIGFTAMCVAFGWYGVRKMVVAVRTRALLKRARREEAEDS